MRVSYCRPSCIRLLHGLYSLPATDSNGNYIATTGSLFNPTKRFGLSPRFDSSWSEEYDHHELPLQSQHIERQPRLLNFSSRAIK